MSVIVHGGTIDSQKIIAVPTPKDRQVLEALARYIPPGLVKPCKKYEYPLAGALVQKARPLLDLILWDRGFYGYSLLRQAIDTSRYVLGRVSKSVLLEASKRCPMVLFWRGYIPLGRPVGDAKTVGLCV